MVEVAAGYACSLALGQLGYFTLSGGILIVMGIVTAIYYCRKSRKLTDFRVLLALSWLMGEGIAALKLSNLQSEWTLTTWFAFGGFFLCFLLSFEWTEKKKIKLIKQEILQKLTSACEEKEIPNRLYHSILIVCGISFAAFVFEAVVLGYIPLFSTSEEQTYGMFHISGVHYFTVSCMLTHSLTLIYVLENKEAAWKRKISLIIVNLISLSIPIMCVSKFQFLLTVLLPIFIFLQMNQKINWKRFLPQIAAAVVLIGIILTILVMRRNYESGYLQSVFEMKNSDMPVIIQYIYIYIANNFDNFNCLTEQLPKFTMGMRMLFPVFALTGLKFVIPQLVAYPIYVTKEELTTLTIIYDAYYDFGLIGVFLFGLFLGMICAMINEWSKSRKSPYAQLFYALTAVCISLAFFSTWFSNPTIWFWYAISALLWIYVSGVWKNVLKRRR